METVRELIAVAMAIVVQLGVPVVVIFLVAYVSYRSRGRQPWFPRPAGGDRAAERPTVAAAGEGDDASRRQLRHCPSAASAGEMAGQPATPCWQSVKEANGRLRNECLDCQSFLARGSQVTTDRGGRQWVR